MELKDIDKLFRDQQHSADELPREDVWYRLEEKVEKMRPVVEKNKSFRLMRYVAAACIGILFLGSAYFLNIAFTNSSETAETVATTTTSSKEPITKKSARAAVLAEADTDDLTISNQNGGSTTESKTEALSGNSDIAAESEAREIQTAEVAVMEYEEVVETVSEDEYNYEAAVEEEYIAPTQDEIANADNDLYADMVTPNTFANPIEMERKPDLDELNSVMSAPVVSAPSPPAVKEEFKSVVVETKDFSNDEITQEVQVSKESVRSTVASTPKKNAAEPLDKFATESADNYDDNETLDEIVDVVVEEKTEIQADKVAREEILELSIAEPEAALQEISIAAKPTVTTSGKSLNKSVDIQESTFTNARSVRYKANNSEFNWMEGAWSNETSSSNNFIDVSPSASGELRAQNYKIENSDTVLFEELRFRTDANGTKVLKKRAETDTDYTHYLLIKSDENNWTFLDDNGTKLILEKKRNTLYYHFETVGNERITSPKKFKKLN